MDRRGVFGAVLTICALSACTATPSPPTDLGAEETWILQWVQGAAEFEFDRAHHVEYPKSPHKSLAEEFEAAAKCLPLRGDEAAARRSGLLTAVLEHWADGVPADPGRAERGVRLFGLLADPAALPAIRVALEAPSLLLRAEALRALGRFSSGRREERFVVFGGRWRIVVFPPAPDAEAYALLVDAIASLDRGDGSDPVPPPEEGPERDRIVLLRLACEERDAQEGRGEWVTTSRDPGVYELRP